MRMEPDGNYDDLCEEVILRTRAAAAVLIICGGEKGNGCSLYIDMQRAGSFTLRSNLPDVLRQVADQIEADARRSGY